MKDIARRRPVNLDSFKPDIRTPALSELLFPRGASPRVPALDFFLVESLTTGKLAGRAGTGLTLHRPEWVQTYFNTAHAYFDTETGESTRAVVFTFAPSAYGMTQTSDYLVSFFVQCKPPCTFAVGGSPHVANPGERTVSGQRSIEVVMKNVGPTGEVSASITQTSGTGWSFYQLRIARPVPIFRS